MILLFDLDGTLADCEHRRHFVEPPLVTKPEHSPFQYCEGCNEKNGKPHNKKCFLIQEWKPDWESFFREDLIMQDKLLPAAAAVYHAFCETHVIVIVTGRMEKHRGVSGRWLREHGIISDTLLMRKDDDFREDYIVKEELLQGMLKYYKKEEILFALDDRNQTVAMWRRNGIPCFQVADGDF